tara:strand:- start:1050 stop:2012 length:963 start_codon:yes stop_codon:yes gene_type:complete
MKDVIRCEQPSGTYAEVVQHSASPNGAELLTVSVKYPLLIHAEFLRHRQLSRCVKSNRAIPCKAIRAEVLSDPYVPQWFGKNQKGMVSDEQVRFPRLAKALWKGARYPAVFAHWIGEKVFSGHKEWLNRLLNPWQWVRETITATEWDNLYNLRIHKDAQRDIRDVVEAIYNVSLQSRPLSIKAGEYHVPYVARKFNEVGCMVYKDSDGSVLDVTQAIESSAARCARSSYDNHDKTACSWQGDVELYKTLISSVPAHASPVEHQATPMMDNVPEVLGRRVWESGTTHIDAQMGYWSGNLKGWVQHRQTLKGHTCEKYIPHK